MFECTGRECSREGRECASRDCSRDARSDELLSYERPHIALSHEHSKSSTFSVVQRVGELSGQFNTLQDRLLRIEQKDPDSFLSTSSIGHNFLHSLQDLRDRMDKFDMKPPAEPPITTPFTSSIDQNFLHSLEDLRDRVDKFEMKLLVEPPITTPFDTPKFASLEREAQEQSIKLEVVSHKLSEMADKSDEVLESRLNLVFESKLNSALGPLKEELAALQKRVSQLSFMQQDAEEQDPRKVSFPEDLMYVKQPVDENALQPPHTQDHRTEEHDCQKQTSFNEIDEGGTFNSERVVELIQKVETPLGTPLGRARLEYRWQDSVWDVSILFGTEHMSFSSSLTAGLCLFCYLVLIGFLVSESSKATAQRSYDMTSREEFSYWRSTVAHQLNLLDPVTGESLARGVCNERLYLPFASLQLDTVQVLSDYLEAHPFIPSACTGVFMCTLVLFVWSIRLIHELALTLDLVSAIVVLPISPQTRFKQHLRDSSVEIVSLSKSKKVFSLTLQLGRIVVAIAVGWSGSQFLIQETSLTDMVLNAVAMEFILDLDELIFQALLPKKPRRSFERLAPLKYELHNFWAWQRVGYLMLVLSLGVLNKFLVLDPYVTELEKNLEALCGGVDDSSFDFVMAIDSIGMPWAAATSNSGTMVATYAQQAVSEAKEFGFPRIATPLLPNERTNLGPFMQIGSPSGLEKYMLEPEFDYPTYWTIINPENMDYVVGWNEALVFGGTDFGDAHGTVYNRYLQFLLGVSWQVNCSNVPLSRCYENDDRAGLLFRKLCPRHCGCDAPTNGTVSSPWASNSQVGLQGCSEWVTRTRNFVKIIGDLPCEDANGTVFIRWLQGIGDARNGDGVPLADQLLASFESGGCAAVAEVRLGGNSVSRRMCAESSLPVICPTSCGCDANSSWWAAHKGREEYCPQSCGKLQSVRCHTIHVNHSYWTGETGPYVGLPCIFPFVYKGKNHTNCTTLDWSGPWCYVTKQDGDNHLWGDCPPGC